MENEDYLQQLRADLVFEQTLCEQPLTFHSTWGLFSPREIDEGTRLLLKHLKIKPDDDCLDIGCGYGPIGLTMAKLAPRGHTLLVDKDFVAVDFSNKNIRSNQIANAQAILSNGFNQIDSQRHFDVIASNIPAKVGKELLTLFLYDAKRQLKPEGQLCVVTINGLRRFMRRYMEEVFGNYKKVKQGKNYTVAMATLTDI